MKNSHKNNGLSAKVYEYIIDQIFSGKLKQGQSINEPEIAEACGTSRTPVRQALKQLESEAIVTIVTNKYTEVTTITDETIHHLGEVRLLFDWITAKLVAYYGSDADFNQLRGVAKKCDEKAAHGDLKDCIEADAEFHLGMAKLSKNKVLYGFMRELFLNIGLMQAEKYRDNELAMKSINYHNDIVDALFTRDSRQINDKLLLPLMAFYDLDEKYDESFFNDFMG